MKRTADAIAGWARRTTTHVLTRNKAGIAASLAIAPFAGASATQKPGVFKRIMDRRRAPGVAAFCVSASFTFVAKQLLAAAPAAPSLEAAPPVTTQAQAIGRMIVQYAIGATPEMAGALLFALVWIFIIGEAWWRAFFINGLNGWAWDRKQRQDFARRQAFWLSSKLIYWSAGAAFLGLGMWTQLKGLRLTDPTPWMGLATIVCALLLCFRRDRQEAIDIELFGGARIRVLCLLSELLLILLLAGAALFFVHRR